MKLKIAIMTLVMVPLFSLAKSPDCHSWPMNMAEAWLKNSGIVDITHLDESKTEVKLLASEPKGKNRYTQIYRFIFHGKDGKTYQVITNSDASNEECSISQVDSYLVSQSEITH